MIYFTHKGDLLKTRSFLNRMTNRNIAKILNKYGREGVRALAAATPVDSGLTASSWDYELVSDKGRYAIHWINSNNPQGVSIAIILQYGHATGNGGYVQGRDYINPAIGPIFDKIAEEAWQEVTA